jgi:hypothetical protein
MTQQLEWVRTNIHEYQAPSAHVSAGTSGPNAAEKVFTFQMTQLVIAMTFLVLSVRLIFLREWPEPKNSLSLNTSFELRQLAISPKRLSVRDSLLALATRPREATLPPVCGLV